MFFVNVKAPSPWQRCVIELPCGELKLYFSETAIGRLVLPGDPVSPQGEPSFVTGKLPWGELENELKEFFKGREIRGSYPLLADGYSSFTLKVLQLTAAIPFGETRTYGEIAVASGSLRGARAVGQALGRNNTPLLIPCHRVIGQRGALGGFSSGLGWKRQLLALEGHRIS